MRSLHLKRHGDTGDRAGGHRDEGIAGHPCGDRQGLGAAVVVHSSSSKVGADRVVAAIAVEGDVSRAAEV